MSTGLCLAAIRFVGMIGDLVDGGSVKNGVALKAVRGRFFALLIGAIGAF
ncbi:MAG: hypothetical protein ACTHQQ_02450 [Solirubrobacteraceae bacterium]